MPTKEGWMRVSRQLLQLSGVIRVNPLPCHDGWLENGFVANFFSPLCFSVTTVAIQVILEEDGNFILLGETQIPRMSVIFLFEEHFCLQTIYELHQF